MYVYSKCCIGCLQTDNKKSAGRRTRQKIGAPSGLTRTHTKVHAGRERGGREGVASETAVCPLPPPHTNSTAGPGRANPPEVAAAEREQQPGAASGTRHGCPAARPRSRVRRREAGRAGGSPVTAWARNSRGRPAAGL